MDQLLTYSENDDQSMTGIGWHKDLYSIVGRQESCYFNDDRSQELMVFIKMILKGPLAQWITKSEIPYLQSLGDGLQATNCSALLQDLSEYAAFCLFRNDSNTNRNSRFLRASVATVLNIER